MALLACLSVLPLSLAPASSAEEPVVPALEPVSFEHVTLGDGFWQQRLDVVRAVTVPLVLERCFETGRVANLQVAGGLAEGEFVGRLYDDSDVYKALEGVARVLHLDPDSESSAALKARAQEVIDAIEAAQCADGYLSSYYQLVHGADTDVAQRWTNVAHGHELYCIGHLIEAGVAWKRATGEGQLLDVGIRAADHVGRVFLGMGARTEAPGHQELELALYLLSEETGEARFAALATDFLERRGRTEWDGRPREPFGEYTQDHVPIRELSEPVGHAVRLMYQLCGMTDLVRTTGDREVLAALERTWRSIVDGHLYVTGGIGAMASNEGFGEPGDLPDLTAYNETCAGIGMVLWNHRMGLLTGEAKYFDLVERALHNNVLAGLSLDGERFFYVNPTASNGGHHRVPWFDCSCCPTNLARVLPSVGGLVFAEATDGVSVLQEIPASATLDLDGVTVELAQGGGILGGPRAAGAGQDRWPLANLRWIEARVEGEVSADRPVTLRVRQRASHEPTRMYAWPGDGRIMQLGGSGKGGKEAPGQELPRPSWDADIAHQLQYARSTHLPKDEGAHVLFESARAEPHFIDLVLDAPGTWRWEFPGSTEAYLRGFTSGGRPDPWAAAQGRSRPGFAAHLAGPFVMALEAANHGGRVVDLSCSLPEPRPAAGEGELGERDTLWLRELGLEAPVVVGQRLVDGENLAPIGEDPGARAARRVQRTELRFVPYFAWDDQAPGEMRIWVPRSGSDAELPGEPFSARAAGLRVTASHCYAGDSVASLVDDREPGASGDHSLPRHTFWDHRGTEEWVQVAFDEPREVSAVEVYWFDDTGRGSCRVPAAWRLEERVGEDWVPVETHAALGVALDRWNAVTFEPRTTADLRLVIQLQDGLSGGLLGLRVR